MGKKRASEISIPQKEERIWELYHENSKHNSWHRGAYKDLISPRRLDRMHVSLPYHVQWTKKLKPSIEMLKVPLAQALSATSYNPSLESSVLDFEELSNILDAGFRIYRQKDEIRGLRSYPSPGNTFPIEGYFYASHCDSLPQGLYHMNPNKQEIQLLRRGNHERVLEAAFMQKKRIENASMIIFLTAVLSRTTQFFGERGYRMALLETGHIAQNIHLTVKALGLEYVNVCDFYDRKMEDYLEIDGIDHTLMNVIVIGKSKQPSAT